MGQEKTAGGEGENDAHGHEPKGPRFVGRVTDQSDVSLRHLKSVGLSVTHLNECTDTAHCQHIRSSRC
eukprot:2123589-Rhodomonas_salina.1